MEHAEPHAPHAPREPRERAEQLAPERAPAGTRGIYVADVGDSTSGPIGFVADVIASSPESALDSIRRALPESLIICLGAVDLRIHLNPQALTIDDIELDTAFDQPDQPDQPDQAH